MTPELWNRKELYQSIWKRPLYKVAYEYGVSAETITRICKKLQILRPGRGYWRRIEVGQHIPRKPLPAAKDLPIAPRVTKRGDAHSESRRLGRQDAGRAIERMLSKSRFRKLQTTTHPLILATQTALSESKLLSRRWILRPAYGCECLDLRVSKFTLKRALKIINAILLLLEEGGHKVKLLPADRRMVACIDEQEVPFYLREKLRLRSRHEVKRLNLRLFEYQPAGDLEFRVGESYLSSWCLRDGPQVRLENAIYLCLGGLMQEARRLRIAAEQEAKRERQQERKRRKIAALSKAIAKEEHRVTDLQNSVKFWREAQEIRKFAQQVENHTINGAPMPSTRKRIRWMEQQADRFDPFQNSPNSIIDRKAEISQSSNETPWSIFSETGAPSHFIRVRQKRR